MSTLQPILIRRPADVSLEVFIDLVWHDRHLALHPNLLADLRAARGRMMHALAGDDPVYGINTGMGYVASVRLSEAEQAVHQANLFLGRAVGGPPFFSRVEARAIMLARLVGFLSGHAAVTPELCAFLVDRLNDGFVPAIPRTGLGSAGEIIPLAHAFGTFLGLGQIVESDETLVPAADGLQARGVAPFVPAVKEGIALLAGAPGTLALAICHHQAVTSLLRQVLVCWACAVDAMGAPHEPYHPAIAELSHDPVMGRLLDRLAVLLGQPSESRHATQAPVSFRVIPQVLSHLQRTTDRLEEDIRRGLLAVTDSPVFQAGEFLTSGAFHAIGLASALDGLSVTLVQIAELASQHVHRLLDSRFSGLPDQLTPLPGPRAGLVVVHKRVVGVVHEMRRLAVPATVGITDTSLGQEDAVTFAFEAAEKLRRAEHLLRVVVACELLTVRQAWTLRGSEIPEGLREYASELAEVVAPIESDRQLGPEIDALAARLADGRFA